MPTLQSCYSDEENGPKRGRGRPRKALSTIPSIRNISPDSELIGPSEMKKSITSENGSHLDMFESSQVNPFLESTTKLGDSRSSKLGFKKRYLADWVPKLHQKKLVVEGNLLEINVNFTLVSPNGRWLTTEIVDVSSPFCIRTKTSEYWLDGPISLSNCDKNIPDFIIDTFLEGFQPSWKLNLDRWLMHVEQREANEKSIEMRKAGRVQESTINFSRYSYSHSQEAKKRCCYCGELTSLAKNKYGNFGGDVPKRKRGRPRKIIDHEKKDESQSNLKRQSCPSIMRVDKIKKRKEKLLENPQQPYDDENSQSDEDWAVNINKKVTPKSDVVKRKRGRPSIHELLKRKNGTHLSNKKSNPMEKVRKRSSSSSASSFETSSKDGFGQSKRNRDEVKVFDNRGKENNCRYGSDSSEAVFKQPKASKKQNLTGFLSAQEDESFSDNASVSKKVRKRSAEESFFMPESLNTKSVSKDGVPNRKRGRPRKMDLEKKDKGHSNLMRKSCPNISMSGEQMSKSKEKLPKIRNSFGDENNLSDEDWTEKENREKKVKRRGRPPKRISSVYLESNFEDASDECPEGIADTVFKQPEIPKTHVLKEIASTEEEETFFDKFKKKRGRPRKIEIEKKRKSCPNMPKNLHSSEDELSPKSKGVQRRRGRPSKHDLMQRNKMKIDPVKNIPQNLSTARIYPEKSILNEILLSNEKRFSSPETGSDSDDNSLPFFQSPFKNNTKATRNLVPTATLLVRKKEKSSPDLPVQAVKEKAHQSTDSHTFNANPKTISDRRHNAKVLQQQSDKHQDDFFATLTRKVTTEGPQNAKELQNMFPDSDVDYSIRSGSTSRTPINKYFDASTGNSRSGKSPNQSYLTDSGENRMLKELQGRPVLLPQQKEPILASQPCSNSQELAIKLLEIEEHRRADEEMNENCMESDEELTADSKSCGGSELSLESRISTVPKGLLDLYKSSV